MGNNSSIGETNRGGGAVSRGSDNDLFKPPKKKISRRSPCPPRTARQRRADSLRRNASLKRKKSRGASMRRNFPHNKRKAARLAQREQEKKITEEQRELFAAAARGDVEAVENLLEMGADIYAGDANHMTALHHAAMHAREKVIKVLIERGAEVNAGDLKGGFTPLHWVVINANPQMGSTDHVDESIVALARGGADINCTDFNFATPLHIAAQKDNKVCIDTLIRLGADPYKVDIIGRSCVSIAKSEEIKEMLEGLHSKKRSVVYHVLEIPAYHVLELPVCPSPDSDTPPPTPPRRRKAQKS